MLEYIYMYDNLTYLATVILGLVGFLIASNICYKKACQKPMVCPLKMKCEQVLYSKYSKFLGIPVEILGMFYYGLIVISYSIFLFAPTLKNPFFVFAIFMATVCGFVFSTYLFSVQLLKLKEFCSWCLVSAAISTVIFILVLQTRLLPVGLMTLTYGYKALVVIIYALATSLGLGVAIITEMLFIRFLKDSRISKEESSTMHLLHQTIWLALGIMAVSNYAIYLTDPSALITSSKFLAKIFVLTILIVANLVYDLFVSSRLVEIFADERTSRETAIHYLKRMPFIFGPISLSSWLLISIFEMIKSFQMSIPQFLTLYLVVLVTAIFAGTQLGKRVLGHSFTSYKN